MVQSIRGSEPLWMNVQRLLGPSRGLQGLMQVDMRGAMKLVNCLVWYRYDCFRYNTVLIFGSLIVDFASKGHCTFTEVAVNDLLSTSTPERTSRDALAS